MTQLEYSRFKIEINLTRYAASLGYEIDRRKTTRSSIVMKNGADKVIISRRGAIWVYFSVSDDRDNGTIIDFAAKRTGQSLYEIGCILQSWLDGSAVQPPAKDYAREVSPQEYDPARIARIFKRCSPCRDSAYLKSRGLTGRLLSCSRFAARIYQDRYQNAVFPHYKQGQLCGLELKNSDKALFVRGSEKTLWRSHIFEGDDTFIIGEAVIDALSYYGLFGYENAVYAATGGGLSPEQGEIIAAFISSCSMFKEVIIIPDHDEGGTKIAAKIEEAISKSGYAGTLQIHTPDQKGQDWNDVFQESPVV